MGSVAPEDELQALDVRFSGASAFWFRRILLVWGLLVRRGRVSRFRVEESESCWSKGGNALLAVKCRIENNRWADCIDRNDCRVAIA